MIIVVNDGEKVTNIYTAQNESDLGDLIAGKQYNSYTHTSAYVGLDISAVNPDGGTKSIKEQLELGMIELSEDEIFDENVGYIRSLDDQELRIKYPEKYQEQEDTEIDLLQEKTRKINQIKDEYFTADIEGNEQLKISLRKKYLTLQKEIQSMT